MSWAATIWVSIASACLTLAAIYFLVWCRNRGAWANLIFSATAVATAVLAAGELALARAQTPEQFGLTIRWIHVPVWAIILGLIGFVRLYLRAGRTWLAWAACVLRTAALLPNFLTGQNLNYLEMTRLSHVTFLGSSCAVGGGTFNPWAVTAIAGTAFLVIYTMDAMITAWRRGDRRMAALGGGSIIAFAVMSALQAQLLLWGVIEMPLIMSFFSLGVLAAMGHELSRDVLRAAHLAEELRRNQERMAESEQMYRTLFESAPEGIVLIGPDGCIAAANAAQARLYGYDSAECMNGVYAPMCVAEKDRERSRQVMQDVLKGQTRLPRRYTAVRLDGTEFTVEVTSSGLLGPDGQVRGYLCLTRDITESERTEAALKESEKRFRQVAEIAGEFIWEIDAQGLYTYASPSVEKILGYTPDELVGIKRFYDLFPSSACEELKAAMSQVLGARRAFREVANSKVSKSGAVLYLETSGTPVLDASGNLVGYRGADNDVTARTMAQAEIMEQRNELAHLSRVTVLGELAGSLAHELNQPLAAILSNAQAAQRFLADGAADLSEVRDILRDIATDDQRAGEIIRKLRALLKKGEIQHGPLDVNDVVQDVLRLVHSDLLNHNILLRTEFAKDLPIILGDRVQLQQVVLNLIMNAVDAMAQISPTQRQLVVCTERPTEGGARVAIIDQGTGLRSDIQERIFSPYFTTKPGGMGMGLKVSRTIIAAHGGRLDGRNNHGKGATFAFTLPSTGKAQP